MKRAPKGPAAAAKRRRAAKHERLSRIGRNFIAVSEAGEVIGALNAMFSSEERGRRAVLISFARSERVRCAVLEYWHGSTWAHRRYELMKGTP